MMKVNDKIRLIRETHDWSQEDMADKLNMSTNGYAKIERGETRLNLPKMEQIAEVFGMNLVELLSIEEKGDIYLANENFNNHFYGDSTAEIEKLKLTISHKDELLAQQAREIETLQTLVTTLQQPK